MNVHMTKDEQFASALLLLGNLPNIHLNLIKHTPDRLGDVKTVPYPEFAQYRRKLIDLLEEADMFDVRYIKYGNWGSTGDTELTEKAALWIGEYFRWMATEQKNRLHTV